MTAGTPSTAASRSDVAVVQGPWLALARIAVIAYGVTFIVLFAIAVPVRYRALTTSCAPVESCGAIYLSELETAVLPAWLTIEAYAIYHIAIEVGLVVIVLLVAGLIFLLRSHTRMGLLAALVIVQIGFIGEVIPALVEAVPLVGAVYWPLVFGGVMSTSLFVLVFPDGKVEPPWLRKRFPLFLLALVGLTAWGPFVEPLGLVWLATLLFSFAVQVVRYSRYASPEQRQQVKWGVVGLGSVLLGTSIWVFAVDPTLSLIPRGTPRLTWNLLGGTLMFVALGMFPITLFYAILRRRLWDIDSIINRALVYGSLTVTIAVIYVGTVVVLQRVVLSGQQSPLVVAGSTLLIAALFAPLRRRIQAFIDRRFYRNKYDSRKALEAFAATVRGQVDLDALTVELLRVVGDTVQPRQLSLWLKPDSGRGRGGPQ